MRIASSPLPCSKEMTPRSRGPVVYDTGVFATRFHLAGAYWRRGTARSLKGLLAVISVDPRCRAWLWREASWVGPGTGSGGWSMR